MEGYNYKMFDEQQCGIGILDCVIINIQKIEVF